MHKRRVIRFFILLALFGIILLVAQKAYFGSISGNVIESQNADFNARIVSSSYYNGGVISDILFSSEQPVKIKVYGYAIQNKSVLSSSEADIAISQDIHYSLKINVSKNEIPDTIIVYASDGQGYIKLSKDVSYKSISGFVVIQQASSDSGIWVAILIAATILSLVIVFGIIINRHRAQAKLMSLEQTRPRYIKIDVR